MDIQGKVLFKNCNQGYISCYKKLFSYVLHNFVPVFESK